MDDFRQLLSEISHCPVAEASSALGVLLSLFPATELSACKQEVYFNFQSHGAGKLISLVCCLSARILPLTNSKSIQRNHGSYIGQLIFSIIDSPRLLAGLFDRRALLRNGLRSAPVQFWRAARDRTAEILQKGRDAVKPEIDFALTEVVHCKSQKERGVAEALHFCSDRYLERVLSISAAKVLIVYGRFAKDAVHRRFGSLMSPLPNGLSLVSIRDNPRILVLLPHPNAMLRR